VQDVVKEATAESTRDVRIYGQIWLSKPEAMPSDSCGNMGRVLALAYMQRIHRETGRGGLQKRSQTQHSCVGGVR